MKSYFWKKGCLGSNMQECVTCLKIICTTHKDKCCDPNPNPNDNNTTPPSTTNINNIKNIPEVEVRRSSRIPILNRKYVGV